MDIHGLFVFPSFQVVKFSYQLFERPSIDDDDDHEPTECARFGGPTAATTTIERSNRDHWVDRVMTRSNYLGRSSEVRDFFWTR